HRLEELDGDLLLRLVDLHHAGLLALERPRHELHDVPLHDPADDGLRGEVQLDVLEPDRLLALRLDDPPGPPDPAADLLAAVGVTSLPWSLAQEVIGLED